MQPAFFLDRDGTLILEKNYLSNLANIQLLDTVGQTLHVLRKKGFLLLMITNQSAVARGIITECFVAQAHQKINQLLLEFDTKIDDCFYCPHHLEGKFPYNITCNCRKPKIGMVEQAKKKYSINIERSWVIGDKITDIELANNVGCQSALVLTGYGSSYQDQLQHSKKTKVIEKFIDILNYI